MPTNPGFPLAAAEPSAQNAKASEEVLIWVQKFNRMPAKTNVLFLSCNVFGVADTPKHKWGQGIRCVGREEAGPAGTPACFLLASGHPSSQGAEGMGLQRAPGLDFWR